MSNAAVFSETVVPLIAGIAVTLDYAISFTFGALVIFFHSYRQLNQPSYEIDTTQVHVLALASPSDLSGRRGFMKAFAFYVSILLITYLVLCVFATAAVVTSPLLDELGLAVDIGFDTSLYIDASGATTTDAMASSDKGLSAKLTLSNASWPLFVALAMMGLGATNRTLREIEATFRRIAHSIVGIPDNMWDIVDTVRGSDMFRAQKADGAIGAENDDAKDEANDLARAEAYISQAREFIESRADNIARNLPFILMANLWLFTPRPGRRWPTTTMRLRFQRLEEFVVSEVGNYVTRCENNHDLIAGTYEPSGREKPQSTRSAKPEEIVRATSVWRDLSDNADRVAQLTASLLALYAINTVNVDQIRSKRLRDLIVQTRVSQSRRIWDTLLLAVVAVCFMVFIVTYAAAYLGAFTPSGGTIPDHQDIIGKAVLYGVGALTIYVPASFFAWFVRYYRRSNGQWVNYWQSGTYVATGQFVSLGLLTYIGTFCFLLLFDLANRIGASTDWTTLYGEFMEQGLSSTIAFSFLGLVQGIFVAVWLDLHQAHAATKRRMVFLPLLQGFSFAGVCTMAFSYIMPAGGSLHSFLFEILLGGCVGYLMGFLILWISSRRDTARVVRA